MNAELKTQEKQVRRKHKKISFLVKHGVNWERYLSCNLIFLIKKKKRDSSLYRLYFVRLNLLIFSFLQQLYFHHFLINLII